MLYSLSLYDVYVMCMCVFRVVFKPNAATDTKGVQRRATSEESTVRQPRLDLDLKSAQFVMVMCVGSCGRHRQCITVKRLGLNMLTHEITVNMS